MWSIKSLCVRGTVNPALRRNVLPSLEIDATSFLGTPVNITYQHGFTTQKTATFNLGSS
jgi:hypothetical protein